MIFAVALVALVVWLVVWSIRDRIEEGRWSQEYVDLPDESEPWSSSLKDPLVWAAVVGFLVFCGLIGALTGNP